MVCRSLERDELRTYFQQEIARRQAEVGCSRQRRVASGGECSLGVYATKGQEFAQPLPASGPLLSAPHSI